MTFIRAPTEAQCCDFGFRNMLVNTHTAHWKAADYEEWKNMERWKSVVKRRNLDTCCKPISDGQLVNESTKYSTYWRAVCEFLTRRNVKPIAVRPSHIDNTSSDDRKKPSRYFRIGKSWRKISVLWSSWESSVSSSQFFWLPHFVPTSWKILQYLPLKILASQAFLGWQAQV